MKRVKSPHFWAGLTLFFTSLLFFYDLFGGRYLLTERDLAPYFIPPRFFWMESLKGFDFPLWNPYQFTGHPFFANPQNAALYPLNSLFFLLPFDVAFNIVIILHFFLAGLFTYIFLRDLKASSTGALISGLTFMLSGYLLSVHSLLTILLSVVWTPLILMFFRRAMLNPGIRNESWTAVFITLSFLGGGIEIVYGNFIVLLIMMIFPVRQFNHTFSSPIPLLPSPLKGEERSNVPPLQGEGKGGGGYRFKSFFVISILFLFLSAIQLIPFLELWMHSIRGQGITYQEATIWSFAPKDILLFFFPDVFGYFLDMKKYWVSQCWLKTMYTGGLPFLLSLMFFLFPHPGPLPEGEGIRKASLLRSRFFFISLMIFSLFLSLGQYNPLYSFVYQYVPFFNGIRYPVKFLYIFILCLAITAGLGFEKFRQFSKERDGKIFKHILMVFSLISGLALLFLVVGHDQIERFLKLKEIDFPQFNHLAVNLFHAKRFIFYLTLFFLLLRVGYEIGWKGWAKALLVFFLTADLFGNMGFYGKEKSEDYFKRTKILEIITSDREPFRTFTTAKTIAMDTPILIGNTFPFDLIKEKHLPSLNMIFEVYDIWGIDVIRLKRTDDLYKMFTGLPSISSSNLIDLYGGKYVISVTPLEEDTRFELVYAKLDGLDGSREDLLKQNTMKLYQHKNPLQRAWLVKDYRVMDSKAILEKIAGKDFIPEDEVLLEEEVSHPNPLPKGEGRREGNLAEREGNKISPLPVGERVRVRGGEAVEFISEINNRLTLTVDAETESILVLSDTYYPGWKVFVNGREGKIHRANYNFRAVVLPKGNHRVEFVYTPFTFKLGLGLTLIGMMACGMLGWINRKQKLRK